MPRCSSKHAVSSKVLTNDEHRAMAADTWTHKNVEKGRRRDFHLKMLRAVGQRGGEVSQMRLQQMCLTDVQSELGSIPGAYHGELHGELAGDPLMLRWTADEKSAEIQDRTRAMMRKPEVAECPISSAALWLSYEMDCKARTGGPNHMGDLTRLILSGKQSMVQWGPDLDEVGMEEEWWSIHLFPGSMGRDSGLRPDTLYREVKNALVGQDLDRFKSAVQHLFRYGRLRLITNAGELEAAKAKWNQGNGTAERTYMAVDLDLIATFIACGWSRSWREQHIMGRNGATWAMIEGEEWLRDPQLTHLTGIPDYIRARLFAGVDALLDKFCGPAQALERGSSKSMTEVLAWLRKVFMQDLPFWLDMQGGHPYFTRHPLFADDASGHFREWLLEFWRPRVMSLHRRGLDRLAEVSAPPPTLADISRLLRDHRESAPHSPEEQRKAAQVAHAFERVCSPPPRPALMPPLPEKTRRSARERSGVTVLFLKPQPSSVSEVMAEYLVGIDGRPPLSAFMVDYALDRDLATWATDSRKGGGVSCKADWGRRKGLVEGIESAADRHPDGITGAIAYLEELARDADVCHITKLLRMSDKSFGKGRPLHPVWAAFTGASAS